MVTLVDRVFQSPQWGSNSKVKLAFFGGEPLSFSPRNGEVILKVEENQHNKRLAGFSPRNGEVILKNSISIIHSFLFWFQSPQWGSNSKEEICNGKDHMSMGFSPRNGEVILKYVIHPWESITCVSVPAMGK